MGRRLRTLHLTALCLLSFFLLTGARLRPVRPGEQIVRIPPADPYSYSNAGEIAVKHVSLDLSVDFDSRVIDGSATLRIRNLTGGDVLVLDTKTLTIDRVLLDSGAEAHFEFGEGDPILGSPLRITVLPDTREVTIEYRTDPLSPGLHWMSPDQAQQDTPYLYSQSETIEARSWMPVQDSPSVRMTWDATVRVAPGYMALMSAENPKEKSLDGVYTFEMKVPIPAYLQSLAVADVEFREIDVRSGVYASPERLDAAHAELQIIPPMMTEAERICGPYIFERYDVLIMPPSYHIGGMEHPRLTFATPSFISGDGDMVKLIAHELAHSWAGDQVTTATWDDPWINEGLTVYLERRIMEAIFGSEYEEMLAEYGLQGLVSYVSADPTDPDTRLHGDFRGRHPSLGFTTIPYQKGGAFWRMLENALGRDVVDAVLKEYFSRYSLDWMDADALVAYLRERVLDAEPGLEEELRINEWVYMPGLPDNTPVVDSERFNQVDSERARFAGGTQASMLNTAGWSAHELIYFLQFNSISAMNGRLGELNGAFDFGGTTNVYVLFRWVQWVAGFGYQPGFSAMERYLGTVGAGGALNNIYSLLQNNGNSTLATIHYRAFRPRYHPNTQSSLDQQLSFTGRRVPSDFVEMPLKY